VLLAARAVVLHSDPKLLAGLVLLVAGDTSKTIARSTSEKCLSKASNALLFSLRERLI